MNDSLAEVLAFARLVGPVFPVHGITGGRCSCGAAGCDSPGKHPRIKWWQQAATIDPAQIERWAVQFPGCNWGMPTGPSSGIDVLDKDPRHNGDQSLATFEAANGPIPETVRVFTQSDGAHDYFKHDPAHPVKNGTGVLGPGVDVRGIGGFVVIPPSIGASGRAYRFDLAAHPEDVPIADWTAPLLCRVNGATPNKPPLDVAEVFAGVPEGQREGKIVSLIGKLRRADVPEEAALITVLEAAARCVPPYPPADAEERVHRLFATYPPAASDELLEPTFSTDGDAIEVETAPSEPEPEPDETPMLPEACWRSGFKEFRSAWGHTTESPDAFLWSAYLVAAAAVLGRGPRLALGVDVHANVYVANLGRSGGARKSTGQAKADRILANVDEGIKVLHGIGSPEGLIEALTDEADRPVRVLVNLGELSTLLRKGAQEATRGLAPLLCTLYDSPPSVSLPNRKNPLEARDPFLCLIGSTTPEWLRADLTVDDVRGGLAGRFCYFVGQPKAPIPLPPRPDAAALGKSERILIEAHGRSATRREYELDPEAVKLYAPWYITERARVYPTAILDTLAQRLHVFAWKAALMFAVLEDTETINAEQMAAALGFADYQRKTQAAVFHGFGQSEAARCAERILAALHKYGPLAGWELAQRVRHVEPQTLARAIQTLAQSGRIELRLIGRKRVWVVLGRQGGTRTDKVLGKGVSS